LSLHISRQRQAPRFLLTLLLDKAVFKNTGFIFGKYGVCPIYSPFISLYSGNWSREFSMIFGKEYKPSEIEWWVLPVSFLIFAFIMIALKPIQ
jgi:hypothetical protein